MVARVRDAPAEDPTEKNHHVLEPFPRRRRISGFFVRNLAAVPAWTTSVPPGEGVTYVLPGVGAAGVGDERPHVPSQVPWGIVRASVIAVNYETPATSVR